MHLSQTRQSEEGNLSLLDPPKTSADRELRGPDAVCPSLPRALVPSFSVPFARSLSLVLSAASGICPALGSDISQICFGA